LPLNKSFFKNLDLKGQALEPQNGGRGGPGPRKLQSLFTDAWSPPEDYGKICFVRVKESWDAIRKERDENYPRTKGGFYLRHRGPRGKRRRIRATNKKGFEDMLLRTYHLRSISVKIWDDGRKKGLPRLAGMNSGRKTARGDKKRRKTSGKLRSPWAFA